MRMKPIYLVLCLSAIACLLYTFSLGWRFHYGTAALDRAEAAGEARPLGERDRIGQMIRGHFLWGMGSGIYVSFVHTLAMVYFLGTGRAIREQTELQNWTSEHQDHSKRLMAQALYPSSMGIVLVVVAAFSGGVTMVTWLSPAAHMGIAAAAVFGQIPIFMRQFTIIHENGKLMDKVVEMLGGENIRIAL